MPVVMRLRTWVYKVIPAAALLCYLGPAHRWDWNPRGIFVRGLWVSRDGHCLGVYQRPGECYELVVWRDVEAAEMLVGCRTSPLTVRWNYTVRSGRGDPDPPFGAATGY